MNKHEKCFICGSNKIRKYGRYYEKHNLVKCSACGFVFMENIPGEQELNEFYSQYSYIVEEYLSPITVASFNKLLDEFEKFRKNNKILDVGCGRGWFLQEAKKRNWQVYGTEYSEVALQMGIKNGIQMVSGPLTPDSFSDNEFDIITSFEVMEHINNPLEELQLIYKFLRKDGLFYCTTPNFNSLLRYHLKENYNIITYPDHLSYYTKRTLNILMKKSGFKSIKFLSTGISITRLKTSKNASDEKFVSENNSDEALRRQISRKWYLKLAKRAINFLLTCFSSGMTLKGYYKKI